MTYVITQSCCSDASCVPVCPVGCIHPTPDEPGFGSAEMLYIDAESCIDCGACVDHCPVSAIAPDYELPASQSDFLALNAAWFQGAAGPVEAVPAPAPPRLPGPPIVTPVGTAERTPLRVAVIGTGPAGFYVAEEILGRRGLDAEVDLLDRLDEAGGLARYGVAPDHLGTRGIARSFSRTAKRGGLRLRLGTEVGRDVSLEELRQSYHAVVLATGAQQDRRLGIPGEDLDGSVTARAVVGWYNGHPDHRSPDIDLDAERAVVVGTGNVALDIARILASDPERLAGTDIASPALEQLRASRIREVVVVGRRGSTHAAFSAKELVQLMSTPGIHVTAATEEVEHTETGDPVANYKSALLRRAADRPAAPGDRTIRFRFGHTPVEVAGDARVRSLRLRRTAAPDHHSELECGLLVRAVGFRGAGVPGAPFDDATGTVPHTSGRVLDRPGGDVVPGLYAAGWIKRGPSGVIGTNKQDARETADALVGDFVAGRLADPVSLPA